MLHIVHYTSDVVSTLECEYIREWLGECQIITHLAELQHLLSEQLVQLVLVDCSLHRDLHNQNLCPKIPFIVLANPGEESILADAIAKGISHYLIRDSQKSYLRLLKALVESAIRNHSSTSASISSYYHLDFAENIDEVFWVSDAERHHTHYLNGAFERIWGVPIEHMQLDSDFFIKSVHPDDQEYVQEIQGLANYPKTLVYRIIQPMGGVRWIQDKRFQVSNDNILGVVQDITERKQAEQALHQALKRERELSELKSHFISMASHQFRTPLAVIQSASDGLLNYYDRMSQDQIQGRLYRIQEKIHQIVTVLDDVLTISHFEDGDVTLAVETIRLKPYCNTIARELIQANRYEHNFHAVYEPDDIAIQADVIWLKQIVQNLLSNAFKYSNKNDSVKLKIYNDSQDVVFLVHNTGSYIPSSDMSKLFEPFHRGSHVSSITGTGLGLTIVKQAVELHHGTVYASSVLGEGTTFIVRLPSE